MNGISRQKSVPRRSPFTPELGVLHINIVWTDKSLKVVSNKVLSVCHLLFIGGQCTTYHHQPLRYVTNRQVRYFHLLCLSVLYPPPTRAHKLGVYARRTDAHFPALCCFAANPCPSSIFDQYRRTPPTIQYTADDADASTKSIAFNNRGCIIFPLHHLRCCCRPSSSSLI